MTSPFTHAVASFDPTDEGVLLWTRAPAVRKLRWFVEPAASRGGGSARSGAVEATEDHDWCVTVDVTGLEPGSSYRYWFESSDGALSPVGRTRTLPPPGVDEVRLAVVCCSDVTMGWFAGYRAVAEEELDLVLHVGDAIYESGKGERRPDGPEGSAVSLADYRVRHAFTRADPDLQAVHLRHPMVFVWDDHDVADNAWRFGAKAHDPDTQGPYEARLAAAARARHEWLPARLSDPRDLLDMHRSLVLGDLAEIVVLDTRIPARDQQADATGALAIDDPDRSLIGATQRTWAASRIADRSHPWTAIVTAVTLSPLKLPIAAADVPLLDDSLPSGYAIVDGEALCTDEWDGYPVERRRLLSMLRARGSGAVVLSGDIHSSWALDVRDGEGFVAAEFVCPSLTSKPMGEQLPAGTQSFADEAAELMPHRRWSDLESNGWMRLSVTADNVRSDWFAVDCSTPASSGRTPRQGRPLASWDARLGPPSDLQRAEAPLDAWPDRGSVPIDWLPPAPQPPRRPSRARWALAALTASIAAAVGLVMRRLRGRTGR